MLPVRFPGPGGWESKANMPRQPLTITTDGRPRIVRDHVTTMYNGRSTDAKSTLGSTRPWPITAQTTG